MEWCPRKRIHHGCSGRIVKWSLGNVGRQSLEMPNNYIRDRFSYPHLTPKKDSYKTYNTIKVCMRRRFCLQFISDTCALDSFIISRKPEVHPIIFQRQKLFQNVGWSVDLWFYVPVNNYGHVETVS